VTRSYGRSRVPCQTPQVALEASQRQATLYRRERMLDYTMKCEALSWREKKPCPRIWNARAYMIFAQTRPQVRNNPVPRQFAVLRENECTVCVRETRLLVGKAKQLRRLFETRKSVVVAIGRRETGFLPEIKAYTAVLATGCLYFGAISLRCSGNTLLVQIQFEILFLHANNFRVTAALNLIYSSAFKRKKKIGENDVYQIWKQYCRSLQSCIFSYR
jgi:hypothetical protein